MRGWGGLTRDGIPLESRVMIVSGEPLGQLASTPERQLEAEGVFR